MLRFYLQSGIVTHLSPSPEVGTIEKVSGHHPAASARHRRHAEAGLDQHLPKMGQVVVWSQVVNRFKMGK